MSGHATQSVCSFPGCGKPIRAKTLCSGHHRQKQLGKTLRPLRRPGGYPGMNLKPNAAYRAKEYSAYLAMIRRCENANYENFHRYGGRGIKVCQKWRTSFQAFLSDMGKRPSEKHRIERKDNDAGYCPENCVWATHKEQMRNTSANRLVTISGETKSLAEWCDIYGRNYKLVHCRITKHGWDEVRALTTPKNLRYQENVENIK